MFSVCEQLGLSRKQEGDDMVIHTQSFTILPIYSVYQQLLNPFNSIMHVFKDRPTSFNSIQKQCPVCLSGVLCYALEM